MIATHCDRNNSYVVTMNFYQAKKISKVKKVSNRKKKCLSISSMCEAIFKFKV